MIRATHARQETVRRAVCALIRSLDTVRPSTLIEHRASPSPASTRIRNGLDVLVKVIVQLVGAPTVVRSPLSST